MKIYKKNGYNYFQKSKRVTAPADTKRINDTIRKLKESKQNIEKSEE